MITRLLLLFTFHFSLFTLAASAATLDSDGSFADVQAKINSAAEGDTVTLPAGAFNWASQLNVTKGITLQGKTTVTGAGTQTATADDQTIILNDSPTGLIKITLTPAQSFAMTGLTLKAGTSKGTQVNASGIGNAPVMNFRIHHNHFVGATDRCVWTSGWLYGVADHNLLQPAGNGQCFFINTPGYGGKALGHGAWADYPWFGTDKFFFIEDNTIIGAGVNTTNGAATDGENGARFVVRHNDCTNSHVGWHGTEGANRGTRAAEIYGNASHWTIAPSAENRSGVAIYHDNTWSGSKSSNNDHSHIALFREFAGVGFTCPYGFADGTGLFDQNDTEGDGTFIDGHAPFLFDAGIVTTGNAATGSPATITDFSQNWTPNQWVGYSIKQTTAAAGSYPKGSHILSNTSNSITFARYTTGDRGPLLSFAAGDSYQIHRVLVPLDQVGRGKGDLLSGNLSVTNTVPGHSSAHQALEPAMSWNNVHTDGTAYGFSCGIPSEVQGRDYYNLGKGLPTNGAPAQMTSIYTAALNGVDYTGPFTYPHPLTAGANPSPSPSPTPIPTATPSPTPLPTPNPTPTPLPSPTPSATSSPLPSVTPGPSPTIAPTPSPSASPAPDPTPIPNQRPLVNAGHDQTVKIGNGAMLSGVATDDGLPIPPSALTCKWTKVKGPHAVIFTDPNSLNTHVSFGNVTGKYVFKLTVTDGALSGSDSVAVTVTR